MSTPGFELVDSALRQLGAEGSATEAHGSFCGLACVLGEHARTAWVAGLAVTEPVAPDVDSADARVLAELGAPSQALDDFNTALAHSANPGPEDYLERAKLQAAVSGPAAAVSGLDEGLRKLGWTLTLQRLAVDYSRAAGDSAGALARLETILERANRKENWLALKGEILQQAGRKSEACAAYEDAWKAIGELPPRLVRAGVVVALQTRVEAALAGLKREGGTNQADH